MPSPQKTCICLEVSPYESFFQEHWTDETDEHEQELYEKLYILLDVDTAPAKQKKTWKSAVGAYSVMQSDRNSFMTDTFREPTSYEPNL